MGVEFKELVMVEVILSAVWDIVSYNDFLIPRTVWGAIRSGSS